MSESEEINIGILVVHGIGDQKQFDCLRITAQSIVNYLKSEINSGYVEVSLDINRATTGTFQSPHPAWQDGEKASINIRIRPTGSSKIYNLHLREVWWADLDQPQGIGKFIQFWFWGLSLWAIPPQDSSLPILNDPDKHLEDLSWDKDLEDRKFKKKSSRIFARLEYALIGLFLIICQPILFVIKTILRLADWNVPLTIIADYVGKLRLYQRPANSGADLIEDLGNPPRFSIQRRMINALVRMAISDYDRWYVWSHSLGSIVAYNAFCMPEATLSHYVSHSLWEEIESWDNLNLNRGLLQDLDQRDLLFNNVPIKFWFMLLNIDVLAGILFLRKSQNNKRPKPYRPVWQTKRISRKSLFAKCQGLLTYGSPFWRITDLWPDLVKRNIQPDFQPDFRWYNVIDPSDPVATRIAELFPNNSEQEQNYKFLHPQDIFYRTSKPFLFAHISYLLNPQENSQENSLISQLYRWATEDKKLNSLSPWEILQKNVPEKEIKTWYLRYHQVWRFIWWFGLIYVSYLFLDGVGVGVLLIFKLLNLSTILNSTVERLFKHFHDDYWSTSSLHYSLDWLASILLTLIAVLSWLISPLKIVSSTIYGMYNWVIQRIDYSKIPIPTIDSLINLFKETFRSFLEFLNTFGLTHAILQIFPNSNLFLFFLGFLMSSGLIRSLRGNPIKSYLLEYFQDRPNERFSQQDLENEFKTVEPAILVSFLRKLVKNREILQEEETNKYFFPYYTFDFGKPRTWKKVSLFINVINQLNTETKQINKIQTLDG
jgi:hypothetical protein